MARPSVTVEFAQTTDPLTNPGTWTDITAYVRSIDTRRGRTHELSRTQAGECTITLRNTDRRFDPTNASGPYFPNLRPMRHIRVRATHLAVTYDLFRGFVEDWGQTWPGRPIETGGDAECVLRAADGFRVLSLPELSAYRSAVLGDGPQVYFPLDDPVGTLRPQNLGAADIDASFGQPTQGTYGVTPGPLIGGSSVIELPGGAFPVLTYGFGSLGNAAFVLPGEVTIEAWVRFDAFTGSPEVATLSGNTGSPIFGQVLINTTGDMVFARDVGGAFSQVILQTNLTTATWFHIAAVWKQGIVKAYVNGAEVDSANIGRAQEGPATGYFQAFTLYDGRMGHLAIYDQALSAGRIAAHYASTFDNLSSQQSGAHIGTVLDVVGWPSALRTLNTGSSSLNAEPSGSALDWLMRVAEDTERGLFYVAGDGKVTFLDRQSANGSPRNTSQATFGEDGAEITYADLKIRYDDQDIYNTITVQPSIGSEGRANDATSTTRYGPRTLALDGLLDGENEAIDHANGLLSFYKDERLRIEALTLIGGQSTDTRYTQMLARNLGDRVTVKRKPVGGGTITADLFVEGIEHSVAVDETWRTTLSFVPVPPNQYWLLGNTPHGDDLGTDSRLGW